MTLVKSAIVRQQSSQRMSKQKQLQKVMRPTIDTIPNQLADLQWAKKDSPRENARPSLTKAYCNTAKLEMQ